MLKRIFVQLEAANTLTLAMKRVIVQFVFVDLLHNFGIDWMLIEVVLLDGSHLHLQPLLHSQ